MFHEIAREHFAHDQSEIAAVDAAVTDILTEWLLAGRLDPPLEPELTSEEDLTSEERRDALQMAVARFRPSVGRAHLPVLSDHWPLYGQSLARLVQLDQAEYRWERAEETAIEFADARPAGWPLEILDFELQFLMVKLLREMCEYERVIRVLTTLAGDFESRSPALLSVLELNQFGRVLEQLGLALQQFGNLRAADERYRQILELMETALQRFGASPQSLRDLSISLDRVGDVELAEGDRAAALGRYVRSLQLREQIVEQFGATPESLRDVSVSLDRVGNVELAEGDRAAALGRYVRSLQLAEQIVEQFGATPESLRDVSVSCERMGDVAAESEPPDLALAEQYYRRCLANWDQLRERYGALPDTLEGPTYSRYQLGMLLLQAGDSSGVELLVAAATDLQTVIDNGWATPATMQRMEAVMGILQQLRGDEADET